MLVAEVGLNFGEKTLDILKGIFGYCPPFLRDVLVAALIVFFLIAY